MLLNHMHSFVKEGPQRYIRLPHVDIKMMY